MTITIRKLFFVWEHEKEEKWLNEMSAAGLQLCGVGVCTYHFEKGAPHEYVYRLEMLEKRPTHAKSVHYIRFVAETGAEHIGSVFDVVYFRKRTQGEAFEIHSDIGSRISHFSRIMLPLSFLAGVNLLNTLNMLRMWIQYGMSVYSVATILTFGISLLLGYGFVRICQKTRRLKREKLLRE